VTIANGIAWTKNRKIVFYVDSLTHRLDNYDFNAEKGTFSNRKTVATFKDEDGLCDGITIDSEDCVWIAHWDGGKVTRYDGNGKLLLTIKLPTKRVTSVAFGGPKLNDLYITTASIGIDRTKDKLAGSLFVVRNTPFTGVFPNLFSYQAKSKL